MDDEDPEFIEERFELGQAYSIENVHAGKCLDVAGLSASNGANIQLWDCSGWANQKFTLEPAGGNYVMIRSESSGKCLDVWTKSTEPGANIAQYTCNGGTNQQFEVVDAGGGAVRIVARHSGQALDAWGWNTQNGTNIAQWPITGGANQHFILKLANTSDPNACGAGLTPNVTVNSAAELESAITNASNGDVISVAAGSYSLSGKSFQLTANNVTIFGTAGSTLLDYQATSSDSSKPGIRITGDGNSICGLTIARAADNGIHIRGSNNTIDRCEFYENFDTGLQISGPQAETTPHPADNLIINCDSHHNYDTEASGENADGFAAKINIGPGNHFYGCVAHDNSDDGWDTFPKVSSGTFAVTIENSVSYHNGYHNGSLVGNGNGFKVGSGVTGGASHFLRNSVAFDNPNKGFDQNHNGAVATVTNCTAVNNHRNVAFGEFNGANISNTVANGGWEQAEGTDSSNAKSASASNFESLDPSKIYRDADGTLHLGGFAVYTPSSAGAHF